MDLMASKAGLQVSATFRDSTDFQFWGSEQCQRGIPLRSEKSYLINPAASVFSSKDIQSFIERAHELNAEESGDSAVFYLRKI
jgi:hypothetical protein